MYRRDEQDISRLDDQAPARPDHASGCESDILGEGQLLGRTVEVGDAGNNDAPFHDGGPVTMS